MTFSIVGRDADGVSFGVAVASKFLAVGSAVPAAEAGTGAIATQAHANLGYRPQGLDRLRNAETASDVVRHLTGNDPRAGQRQLGVVGAQGDGATFTGENCHQWAGGRRGPGYAVQGNILTGPEVVDAMEQTWLSSMPGTPLAHRLLAALVAGDEAGGDRRGRQSAALLVVTPGGGYGGGNDVLMDLRVDDHADPVTELARLVGLHELYFGRPSKSLLPLSGDLAEEVGRLLARVGHAPGGSGPDALDAALASWAGVENLEERLLPGQIDPVVLDVLRDAAEPSN